MNEQTIRIIELAKQADLIQWDTMPSGARTPDYESVVKAKKFAELIVRECVVHVRDEVQYVTDWDVADKVTKRVFEHFGIE